MSSCHSLCSSLRTICTYEVVKHLHILWYYPTLYIIPSFTIRVMPFWPTSIFELSSKFLAFDLPIDNFSFLASVQILEIIGMHLQSNLGLPMVLNYLVIQIKTLTIMCVLPNLQTTMNSNSKNNNNHMAILLYTCGLLTKYTKATWFT